MSRAERTECYDIENDYYYYYFSSDFHSMAIRYLLGSGERKVFILSLRIFVYFANEVRSCLLNRLKCERQRRKMTKKIQTNCQCRCMNSISEHWTVKEMPMKRYRMMHKTKTFFVDSGLYSIHHQSASRQYWFFSCICIGMAESGAEFRKITDNRNGFFFFHFPCMQIVLYRSLIQLNGIVAAYGISHTAAQRKSGEKQNRRFAISHYFIILLCVPVLGETWSLTLCRPVDGPQFAA